MGQKVNPTSLRLHPQNKHFDSCWFSEKQYAHSIHKNLKVEIYYNSILKQIQYPSASFFFEAVPRKSRISVLFLNPAQLRKQVFKQFASSTSKNRKARANTLFSPRKETSPLTFFINKKNEKGGSSLTPSPPCLLAPPFLQKSGYKDFYERRRGEKTPIPTLQETKWRVKNNLQSKKDVCSSLLGLAISRYFIQRGGGPNDLSATSRFLLLQPFFSFLKIEKSSSPHLSSHSESEKRKGNFSLKHVFPLFFVKQKTEPLCIYKAGAKSFGRILPNQKSAHSLGSVFTNKSLQKSSSYAYHIESIISHRLRNSCRTFFFRAHNVAQNALFIAEEIVYQLERRNSFRQIQTKLSQELGNKAAIKGVRVTCVGRIGGRAKKAQRARGESFKMGQTSLHLFDSKVSFASKTGLTPFGAAGVKVWICWK